MQEVNLYIATTIKGPAKQNGHACYIAECEDGTTYKQIGPIHHVGDKAAEVIVLKAGLERIEKEITEPCILQLYVETKYVGDTIGGNRLPKWEQVGWKNSKGQNLANKEEWIRIKELLERHQVEVHIQEHHSFSDWIQFRFKEMA